MGHFGKSEPEQVQVAGVLLHCEICKNELFWELRAQLKATVASSFDLVWANPSAHCHVCSRCGYMHWFLPQ
jgi:hypothetical protein